MTAEDFIPLLGATRVNAVKYAEHLNEAIVRADLATTLRRAHFFAQIGHECNGLLWMEELGTGKQYNGRADLGNTEPGDGEKYKGHGAIQCTGKNNHRDYGIWMGVGDLFVREPRLIVTNPRYAVMTAPWFWVTHKLNTIVDTDDGSKVEVPITEKGVTRRVMVNAALRRSTRVINGGINGIKNRQSRFDTNRRVLGL